MDDTATLESRVRLLERGQRRLIVVCLTLAIGLAASVLWRTLWVTIRSARSVSRIR